MFAETAGKFCAFHACYACSECMADFVLAVDSAFEYDMELIAAYMPPCCLFVVLAFCDTSLPHYYLFYTSYVADYLRSLLLVAVVQVVLYI